MEKNQEETNLSKNINSYELNSISSTETVYKNNFQNIFTKKK